MCCHPSELIFLDRKRKKKVHEIRDVKYFVLQAQDAQMVLLKN